ncbi:MAG: acyl-CoA carboxylase subunit epsilon [Actinomycetota bacterium]|nr:acyl-CoA carboxylase subunit epsilon [Actinomycetota bacterium]
MSERPATESGPHLAPAVTLPAVPLLRIVRGAATPEEVAALAAVMNAAAADGDAPPTSATGELLRGRWNDPAWGHRRPLLAGPGGWRACAR